MSEEGFGSSIPQGLKQRGRGFRRGPDLQCQKGLEEKEELQRKLLNHVYVRIECKVFHGTILNRADVEKQSILHLITLMYSVAGCCWMAFWLDGFLDTCPELFQYSHFSSAPCVLLLF